MLPIKTGNNKQQLHADLNFSKKAKQIKNSPTYTGTSCNNKTNHICFPNIKYKDCKAYEIITGCQFSFDKLRVEVVSLVIYPGKAIQK